jgi:hypothetical protein
MIISNGPLAPPAPSAGSDGGAALRFRFPRSRRAARAARSPVSHSATVSFLLLSESATKRAMITKD